jgi:hypothetical protein
VLIGDQYFELILGTRLLVYDGFNLLKRTLYRCGLLPIFIGELLEGELIHFLLNEH